MKRDLTLLFDILDEQDLGYQIEETKKFIYETEKSQSWTRKFTELSCYHDWKNYYNKYVAEITPAKAIIQKLKLKLVERYQKSLYTDIEALRTLLEAELRRHNKKKLHYRTEFKTANSLYFPYKFQKGRFKGNFIKIDIKKCFYSIYSKIGIDSNIIAQIDNGNKIIDIKAVGQGILTEQNSQIIRNVKDYKTLRNAIYGLTRYCFCIYLYPGGKTERRYIRTNLQNLDLLVIIASLLHSLVYPYWDGILYWNIDGGIVRAEIFEQLKNEIESLGFELEVIEQDSQVEILGLGSYAIGNFCTAHYENGVQAKNEFRENIYRVINAEKIQNWYRRT
jgi:DNA-binding transcriptional MerR regulator